MRATCFRGSTLAAPCAGPRLGPTQHRLVWNGWFCGQNGHVFGHPLLGTPGVPHYLTTRLAAFLAELGDTTEARLGRALGAWLRRRGPVSVSVRVRVRVGVRLVALVLMHAAPGAGQAECAFRDVLGAALNHAAGANHAPGDLFQLVRATTHDDHSVTVLAIQVHVHGRAHLLAEVVPKRSSLPG